ncbi:MAG TPA: aldehyde dehydrogenase family protein [Elusimicrobiota bacterium]|nr:aldehyde dehydrogenase family protein [Elusimicrobiota bacterium]
MPATTKKHPDLKPAASGETLTIEQYIGGEWIAGSSGKEILSINPADTRDVVARFQGASQDDAKSAIAAAQKTFPAWRATPAPQRGRILAKAAQILHERRDELARLMTREEGKILSEAKGEMDKGTTLVEWFAGEGLRLMGATAPSELPSNLLYTLRQPLGVVSIITPWNFPFAIPAWKVSPALVAGNTVVFKPASLVPALAVKFVEILEEAGLPPGVLNLVMGAGSSVGDILIEHPAVKAVSFTGSNSVGRRVHTLAGARGIKVTCEMGGKNPAVVWEDADLELALAGVFKGAFGSTGQRCTATSRLILHEKIADKFLKMLTDAAKKMKIGDGQDPTVGLGPAVDEAQLKTDLDYIETAQKDGAKLLCGGKRAQDGALAHGYFVEPTIFDGVKPGHRIFKEEVFGPVLSVTRTRSLDEMLALVNDCAFGLTCAIYTRDLNLALKFSEEAEVGMVHVNSPTIGGEAQVPFGGVKGSGVGEREMSKEGLHFFTELKTVFLDYTGARRESNIY